MFIMNRKFFDLLTTKIMQAYFVHSFIILYENGDEYLRHFKLSHLVVKDLKLINLLQTILL